MSNMIDTLKSDQPAPPGAPKNLSDIPVPETQVPTEIGGRSGPEPTRYGDWEKDGKCTDF